MHRPGGSTIRGVLLLLIAVAIGTRSWSAPPRGAGGRQTHKGPAQVVSPRSLSLAYLVPPSAEDLPAGAGYSEPSKTEVWVARTMVDGAPSGGWDKSAILDCRDPGRAQRTFPWKTSEQNVAYVKWQIALLPFPRDPSAWEAVPGLVADELAAVRDPTSGQFTVDFASFGPRIADASGIFTYPRVEGSPPGSTKTTIKGWSPDLLRAAEGAVALESGAPQIDRGNPGVPRRSPRGKPRTGMQETPTPAGAGELGAAARVESLSDVGAPDLGRAVPKCVPFSRITYYVRVVPLDAAGQRLGVPSDPVEVQWGVPPDQPGWTVPGWAFPRMAAVPTVRIESYEPIRWQDPDAYYYWVVTKETAFTRIFGWKVNEIRKFEPQREKSWWDEVCDAIGSAFSWIADAVNWVSKGYTFIKSAALDALVGWMGPEWRALADGALTGCMVAMGVPPSLPNFDDLTRMGKGYLVETLAAEAPVPIPREALEGAIDAMADKAADSQRGGDDPAAFMALDESRLYHPAVVLVRVTNTTDAATEACYLDLRIRATNDIFEVPDPARLPSLAPGASFTMPIVLQENVDWFQRLSAERFREGYARPMEISVSPIALANPGQQVTLPQGCNHRVTVTPSQPYAG